jgi:hypothetical protein
MSFAIGTANDDSLAIGEEAMRIPADSMLRSLVRRTATTWFTAAVLAAPVLVVPVFAAPGFAAPGAAPRAAASKAPPAEAGPAAVCTTQRYDTLVDWFATPDEAIRAAAHENKLVFLMQISGNFAREEFT